MSREVPARERIRVVGRMWRGMTLREKEVYKDRSKIIRTNPTQGIKLLPLSTSIKYDVGT